MHSPRVVSHAVLVTISLLRIRIIIHVIFSKARVTFVTRAVVTLACIEHNALFVLRAIFLLKTT